MKNITVIMETDMGVIITFSEPLSDARMSCDPQVSSPLVLGREALTEIEAAPPSWDLILRGHFGKMQVHRPAPPAEATEVLPLKNP